MRNAMRSIVFACVLSLASATYGLKSCEQHNDCGEAQWCFFSYDENHQPLRSGFCFSSEGAKAALQDSEVPDMILLEENEQAALQAPDVKKFEPQGLKVSSLTVQAEEGKQAKVVLKSGSGEPFALRVQENTFSVTKGQDLDVLTVNSNGDVIAKTQVLAAGSLHADKGFIVNDVAQWRLVASEDFASDGVSGFVQDTQKNALSSLETTIVCGVHMVGGVDITSVQTISKTYQNLPKHDQLMVKAVYNFMDDWQGESGFMQLNTGKNGANSFVWTHSLDITNHKNNPSMCGEGEGSKSKGVLRLSSPIEVATRHSSDEVTVTFGSSLTEPLAYYGVSSVEVYVRDSSV